MSEVLSHPWVTYINFPKYIDSKFFKIQNRASKPMKKIIDQDLITEVIEKTYSEDKSLTSEELTKFILTDNNNSSVATYHILLFESRKKEKPIFDSHQETFNMDYEYNFGFIKNIISDPVKYNTLKVNSYSYIIDIKDSLIPVTSNIGYGFCTILKKLVMKLIKAANSEKIKIEVSKNADFRFHCSCEKMNEWENCETFVIQIFDNSDEYILDFLNESVEICRFMMISSKMVMKIRG